MNNLKKKKCVECDKPVQWIRCTQFAADHPYCDVHARQQTDFLVEDNSHFFWYPEEEQDKLDNDDQ